MRWLWVLIVPFLALGCHSDEIAGSVSVKSSCVQQMTTGTVSNPTNLDEIAEVDVTLSPGPTGREMVVGPHDSTPFSIDGCGMVSAKVVSSAKVRRQPGVPTTPLVPTPAG
ncbi:MAG TPA: hypothetical protein VHT30_05965 [Acidimicrobiales bacterium]|nr:hypothetical protein [Acidimicrobiales bacterium]